MTEENPTKESVPDNKLKLRIMMVDIKNQLVDQAHYFPGLVVHTAENISNHMPRSDNPYDRDHQIVIFSEPIINSDGSVTYVIATPDGFKKVNGNPNSDKRILLLKNRIELQSFRDTIAYGDSNGYFLDLKDTVAKPKIKLEPRKEEIEIIWEGDEIIDCDEATLMQAYNNSIKAIATKREIKEGDMQLYQKVFTPSIQKVLDLQTSTK